MSSTTIYSCTFCNKSFTTLIGLCGHQRMHGASQGKTSYPNNVCCIFTKKVIAAKNLDSHYNTLFGLFSAVHACQGCGKFISDKTKYCSRSCGASVTNKGRQPKSQETKNKISKTLKTKNSLKTKATVEIVGKYTKLYHCTCSHCGILTLSRIIKKYCETCSSIYGVEPRNRYKFTFNVYKYPDLFDLELLTEVGFYAPRGKSGSWNPNGLSRDHRVSVNESLKNNYDPFYITHPLNCELMSHKQNNSKKSKSSISYKELVKLVDDYEISLLQAEASNLA